MNPKLYFINLFKIKNLFSNLINIVFFIAVSAIMFVSFKFILGWDSFQIIVWAFLILILFYIMFFNIYCQLEGIYGFLGLFWIIHLILQYYNIYLPVIIFQILITISVLINFYYLIRRKI